jgi:hypothetical protein
VQFNSSKRHLKLAPTTSDKAFGHTPLEPQLAARDSALPNQKHRIGLSAYDNELQCMLLTWRATNRGTGVLHVRADSDTEWVSSVW